ncbi:MAG: ferrochelatase [Eggerthellaceae bacterium]|nr:ferrochelatase [Eggerthellaceae bacterium]
MKRGIVIANTGSPASPDPKDVAVYLEQFLSNPRIVPMNPFVWKQILKRAILPKRSVASGAKYATIWTDGGFQFINDHIELARKLERSFAEDGGDVLVRAAMSFGEPSVPSVLHELSDAGCDKITVLPLYPQSAFSQAYIVADAVAAWVEESKWSGNLEVLGDYSENIAYLSAMADAIRNSDFDPVSGDRLLMSFHSIPHKDVDDGDTYEATVHKTCAWLAREIGIRDGQWATGFQSRFDNDRKWVGPFAHEIFEQWHGEGFAGRLFCVCPNFSVDCLETYYDIEVEMKQAWLEHKKQAGQEIRDDSFVYIPCLGPSDAHVKVIRDVLAHPANYIA